MPEPKKLSANELSFSATGLILPIGLPVDELRVRLGPAQAVFEPFSWSADEAATIEADLNEQSLQSFLNSTAPGGLKDFEVIFADGKVAVTATARVVFEVRATALCTLEIVDEKKLYVRLESVSVPIAHNIVLNQLEKINPIVNTEELPVDIRVSRVMIDQGKLTMHALVRPQPAE